MGMWILFFIYSRSLCCLGFVHEYESTVICSRCSMFYMELGIWVIVRGVTKENKGATTKVRGINAQIWGCTSAMLLLNHKTLLASKTAEKWGDLLAPGSWWATPTPPLPEALAGLPAELLLLCLFQLDQSSMHGKHHLGNTRRRWWDAVPSLAQKGWQASAQQTVTHRRRKTQQST